jgi:patatin-like phospholipase/acyl hydrolase
VPSPTTHPSARFRILAIDGGGIRGLIPALVLAELERRLGEATGREARMADHFHLFAGTSTGGLVALTLTAPDRTQPRRPRYSAAELAGLYHVDGPKIFGWSLHRVLALNGYLGPKYPLDGLRQAVETRLDEVRLAEALRELVITSYDMHGREPFFFKRWRARESPERDGPMVDAALATSAAPTYFPSHEVGDRALVDGGVYVANPTIAAVAEALKRTTDEPPDLVPHDLLVVSLGTGSHETGFEQRRVRRWGKLGWILPKDHDPPLLGAMLDGQSDATDHWAHMLLNTKPGAGPPDPDEIGRGPRYFRLQVPLGSPIPMDDATARTRALLTDAANRLIADHDGELTEIVERLTSLEPLD